MGCMEKQTQEQSDGVQIHGYVPRQTKGAPHSARDLKTLCWDQCGEFVLSIIVKGVKVE